MPYFNAENEGLNSIVGFSQLICPETLDHQAKLLPGSPQASASINGEYDQLSSLVNHHYWVPSSKTVVKINVHPLVMVLPGKIRCSTRGISSTQLDPEKPLGARRWIETLGLQPSPIINIHLPALLMLQVTVS